MPLIIDYHLDRMKVLKSDLCYCGSKKTIAECCDIKEHTPWVDLDNNKNFNNLKSRYEKGELPAGEVKKIIGKYQNKECLSCNKSADLCHTISQSWLRIHFPNGNMTTLGRYDILIQEFIFQKKGISEVSGFYGWCNTHDAIFYPIDQNFDIYNKHHCNLQVLRSVGKEFRDAEMALKFNYSIYYNNIYSEELFGNLLGHYKKYLEFNNFFEFINKGIEVMGKAWSGLIHKTIKLGNIQPLFVTSPITPYGDIIVGDLTKTITPLIFTVYTNTQSEGFLIISYKYNDHLAKNYFQEIKKKEKDILELYMYLNTIISKHCGNVITDMSYVGNTQVFEGTVYNAEIVDYLKPLI